MDPLKWPDGDSLNVLSNLWSLIEFSQGIPWDFSKKDGSLSAWNKDKRFDFKHSKLLEIDCYVDADEIGLLSYEDI